MRKHKNKIKMNNTDIDSSLSIAASAFTLNVMQKIGLAIGGIGLLILFVALGYTFLNPTLPLVVSLLTMTLGTVLYAHATYSHLPEGIKNNGVWFKALSNKGALAWVSGIVITGFYIILYWFPEYLGLAVAEGAKNTGLVALFDPLSQALAGKVASQWFVYGTLYTVAILALGYKFLLKYRHNKYQQLRTISVMFFQLGFAFMLPAIMESLNQPYYNFANMWPLNYYFFDDWHLQGLISSGAFGLFMLLFGIAMFLFISPILTYFYGKRWYCSWVCGCGGLAETAGDPFRQLSDKSMKAWKVERWMIHSVLVFSILMTAAVLFSVLHDSGKGFWVSKPLFVGILVTIIGGFAAILKFKPKYFKQMDKRILPYVYGIGGFLAVLSIVMLVSGQYNLFFVDSYILRSNYGFLVGSAFSGVVGVGFYPIMGSRVWCRFGCPMAAVLGLQQKFFSRFRITTNSGQCISCGNCSTYCEMGIDVRAYAQKGQDIVRASCVGCGICAAVCPRGVLRLENGSMDIDVRAEEVRALHISTDGGIKFEM
ncbi:MAG: polyferredoxin [Saprospiraceae bacterium]